MKFGRLFAQELQEAKAWPLLRYKQLKKALKARVATQRTSSIFETGTFKRWIRDDMAKINTFWTHKQEELLGQGEDRSADEVKLTLKWLTLNYLAVLKIAKKHDKHCATNLSDAIAKVLISQPFVVGMRRSPLFTSLSSAVETGPCEGCYETVPNLLTLDCKHKVCQACMSRSPPGASDMWQPLPPLPVSPDADATAADATAADAADAPTCDAAPTGGVTSFARRRGSRSGSNQSSPYTSPRLAPARPNKSVISCLEALANDEAQTDSDGVMRCPLCAAEQALDPITLQITQLLGERSAHYFPRQLLQRVEESKMFVDPDFLIEPELATVSSGGSGGADAAPSASPRPPLLHSLSFQRRWHGGAETADREGAHEHGRGKPQLRMDRESDILTALSVLMVAVLLSWYSGIGPW